MSYFVGVDISKEKFDACCIDEQRGKVFTLTCSMDREGFEELIVRLPKDKTSFLLGMESTASYHIPLFTYLAAEDYRVVVINPLLNEPPCCKQQGIRGKRPVLKEPCFTL